MANSNTPAPALTEAEIEQMEQTTARWRADQAAARNAERVTKLKPVTDLLASDTWAAFRAGIEAADQASLGEPFWLQINALNTISATLASQVV